MIEWSDRYLTGISSIDHQHERLFAFCNSLEQRLQKGEGRALVKEGLSFLETYIEVHFGAEDLCMVRDACPLASQNRRAHQAFIDRFGSLKTELRSSADPAETLILFHKHLERWIGEHILRIDVSLRGCLEDF